MSVEKNRGVLIRPTTVNKLIFATMNTCMINLYEFYELLSPSQSFKSLKKNSLFSEIKYSLAFFLIWVLSYDNSHEKICWAWNTFNDNLAIQKHKPLIY